MKFGLWQRISLQSSKGRGRSFIGHTNRTNIRRAIIRQPGVVSVNVTQSASVGLTPEQLRHSLDRDVKIVFRDVLAAVGLEGYASVAGETRVDSETENPSLDEQAAEIWRDWYDLQQTGRYRDIISRSKEHSAELGSQYGSILIRAVNEGGYSDPKGFLRKLPSDELDAIRQIQRLVDPIDVTSLSEEGALNLLIPPVAQVDLNRDGLTQSGVAFGIRFPDSRTPLPVAEAWEAATADLSWSEKAFHELQMKLPVLLANIHTNPDGTFSHQVEPGDPEFVNPMADENYSYTDAVQNQLDYLDAFRDQIDPLRYLRDHAFWTKFKAALLPDT
ncbi:MAG: hypothetical protein R3C05_19600 [Pirellulaceae bacterium]